MERMVLVNMCQATLILGNSGFKKRFTVISGILAFSLKDWYSNFCYRKCKCDQKPKEWPCMPQTLCYTVDGCGKNGECVANFTETGYSA